MGMMIKQMWLAQTVMQSDWQIGRGLFTSMVNGEALRSMKAPGTAYDDPVLGRDPQPAHMRGYVFTADDNGGVHINSGILNHAFFLTATRLGGHSWDVAGWLWYVVLEERLSPKATFQDFANATVLLAGQKFGFGGHVQTTVADAWAEVGLQVPLSLIKGGPGSRRWRFTDRRPHLSTTNRGGCGDTPASLTPPYGGTERKNHEHWIRSFQ